MVNVRSISFILVVLHRLQLMVSSASDKQFTIEGLAGANLTLYGAAAITPACLL
jgi:hypothetical protein